MRVRFSPPAPDIISMEIIFERKNIPRRIVLGFLFASASISPLFLPLEASSHTNSGATIKPESRVEQPDIDVLVALNGLCGRLIKPTEEGTVDADLLDLNCGNTAN